MSVLLASIFFLLLSKIVFSLLKSKINDFDCLLIGVILYGIFPFAAYHSIDIENPLYTTWINNFRYAGEYTIYFIAVILLFIAAYSIAKLIPEINIKPIFDSKPNTFVLYCILLVIVSYFLLSTFAARERIGVGYNLEYDPGYLGPLATTNMAFLLLLLYSLDWKIKKIILISFAFLILNSVILLSLGTRLYVLMPALALAIYVINTKKFSRFNVIILIGVVIGISGYVGIWRQNIDFNIEEFLVKMAAEFLLTSITISWYVECVDASLIENPLVIFVTFINFIPSFIYPEKTQLINEIRGFNSCYVTPFGAMSVYVSLLETFGYIGATIVIFLFSYFAKCLRGDQKNGWWLYYYFCCLIPFTLFRDGFEIFVKVFILQGLIFAFIIVILNHLSKKIKT